MATDGWEAAEFMEHVFQEPVSEEVTEEFLTDPADAPGLVAGSPPTRPRLVFAYADTLESGVHADGRTGPISEFELTEPDVHTSLAAAATAAAYPFWWLVSFVHCSVFVDDEL